MVCGASGASIRLAICASSAAASPAGSPAMLRVAPASALAAAAASQEMGADFAMGSGLLGGFWRELFAVGFSDLGKRRRWVAFRADSACETAQKSQAGLAGR